jgi:hypothetical protein
MTDSSGNNEQAIEQLRRKYRPEVVRLLLVGESSPAGGTHFYLANSNLFRGIRDAFELVFGRAATPNGDEFLDLFSERGCWLIDLADRPVDQLATAPRQRYVQSGIQRVSGLIAETNPPHLVAVKKGIAGAVHKAASAAGYSRDDISVLPFPLYQWRSVFVSELEAIIRIVLNGSGTSKPMKADQTVGDLPSAPPLMVSAPNTLHWAIETVLRAGGNRWMSTREIADEIARLGLYVRGDGQPPQPSQIRARANNYDQHFLLRPSGIRLHRGSNAAG